MVPCCSNYITSNRSTRTSSEENGLTFEINTKSCSCYLFKCMHTKFLIFFKDKLTSVSNMLASMPHYWSADAQWLDGHKLMAIHLPVKSILTTVLENHSNSHSCDDYMWPVSLKFLHSVQRYCITNKIFLTLTWWPWPWKPINAHSCDEYVCQVSLKSLHQDTASCRIGVNVQLTNRRTDGQTIQKHDTLYLLLSMQAQKCVP